MSQKIAPQEFHLLQDNPIIRTKCPRELVTDEMISMRVKNGNLAAGDIVRVQCMNNDLSELLAEAEYRVTSRIATLRTLELNDRDIRQVEDVVFKVELWAGWRETASVAVPVTAGISAPQPQTHMKAEWNFGKKVYEIKIGDLVVGFHKDKATAHKMAAGELPLPVAA